MKRLAIICAILLLESNCYACLCWPKPAEIYKDNHYIFIGKVVTIRHDSSLVDRYGERGLRVVEFEVLKFWSDFNRYRHYNRQTLIESITPLNPCGARGFYLDSTYLVVDKGTVPVDIISTDGCMGTALLSKSKDFLAFLDTIPSYTPAYKYEPEAKEKNIEANLNSQAGKWKISKLVTFGSWFLNGVLLVLLIIKFQKKDRNF